MIPNNKLKVVNLGPIGTKADGDLRVAFLINGNHFVIHENAIYEIEKRKGPKSKNLPDYIHRLIFNQGANQPIVGQTLLQTLELLKSNFLDKQINKSELFEVCLEILQEAKVLEFEVENYCALEKQLIEANIQQKGNSIPSIRDVSTRCKTVYQKAHHIQLLLNKIILLFFPGLIEIQGQYGSFLKEVSKLDVANNDLFQNLKKWSMPLTIVRELRNKLDHQNINLVSVKDFYLDPSRAKNENELYIMKPSIKLDTKNAKLVRTDLSKAFPDTIYSIITAYQDTIAFLIDYHLPENLNLKVKEIPEKERNNKWVKYGFWTINGKRFI